MKEKLGLPIGIIGSGTSNDFATYLDLDTEAYFDRIAKGVTKRIDLGKAGDEYFINVASAGMATAIAHEVDVRLKNAIGKLAYYIHGISSLPRFKAMNLHIKEFYGENDHHVCEAMFKAFAKALDAASCLDERINGVLSTKGTI